MSIRIILYIWFASPLIMYAVHLATGLTVSTLAAALLAVMSGLLVDYAARVRRIDGTVNRLGLLLGNASYSIYLFHPHFQSAMLRILARITPWMPPVVVVVMVTIGSVVAGIVVYFVIEKPLVRACQRLVPNRKPPLIPTPAV